ncbi:MAG TPA: hypothetical protein VGS22_27970 [Thermoanaerobaculia bacterium]|nr:hypothetical protein [Thermoanaerobaculia bacterium]
MSTYYSTQSFLSWCLGHYFYSGTHWVWAARPFFPYREGNPKSSNPYLAYGDLYQPWKDGDNFDKFVSQIRLNLLRGVAAKKTSGALTPEHCRKLRRICEKVDILFFYPLVYSFDLDTIPAERRTFAGSALAGSNEVLVEDLAESEFTILFFDFAADPHFNSLGRDASLSSDGALELLLGRC